MNTHIFVADMHRNMLKEHETADGQNLAVSDTRSVHIAK